MASLTLVWTVVSACTTLIILSPIAIQAAPVSFNHGVASGDPTPSSVIIWTRLEPRTVNTSTETYSVNWAVSTRRDLTAPVATGTFLTNSDRDFSVKVDVTGLQSGVQYYYGFSINAVDSIAGASVSYVVSSPIGTFRLPHPEGSDRQKSLRYAIFSCSNWGNGYFNVYDAASRYNLDFWLHLGDWLYEYALLTSPTPAQAVRWEDPTMGGQAPKNEIVTLDDYRKRHARYRQDPGLQALSARAPLMSIWDDHETTNNARANTAQNHQSATEGDYATRKENARKAYFEWMPIRETDESGNFINFKINKTLSFGNLAKVFLLEERLTGRSDEPVVSTSSDESTAKYPAPAISDRIGAIVDDKVGTEYTAEEAAALQQVKAFSDSIRNNASASIMGAAQLEWVRQETQDAKAKGITWVLYNHGTVMLDRYYDYEGAIAEARRTSPVKAAAWERVYRAMVYNEGEQTTTSTGISCFNRPYLGSRLDITDAMRRAVRRNQAAGSQKILSGFDSWPAYTRERDEFLSIAAMVPNAVQYGGDSHAEWAGVQRVGGKTILAEFDVGGVTSAAAEGSAYLPLDFINAAFVAGSRDLGLRYAYNGNKGFALVELTPQVHHAEYIHVDNWCTPEYKATCDFAFDYISNKYKGKGRKKGDFVKSKCKPVLKAEPYAGVAMLNTQFGQQATFVRR